MSSSVEKGRRKEMRIVLLGKTGVGKSAVGNTILGRRDFVSQLSSNSITTDTDKKVTVENNKTVAVVDTPGLFDTEKPSESIQKEIIKCIQLSCPGPHALLVVMQLNRFTDEEKRSVEALQEIFGEEANKYMIVLFTRGDDLEDQSIHQFIEHAHPDLREVIKKCGGRYHVFNNKAMSNRQQVKELLDIIEHMIAHNGGGFYTQAMYEEAERRIKEKEEEIRKSKFKSNMSFWKNKDSEIRALAEKSNFRFSFVGNINIKVYNAYKVAKKR